jgi:elongation factor G
MTIRMEPKEEDENQSVEIRCDYNDPTFTEEFRGVATEALFEESQGGGQLGFPLINVRITIVDVKVHETETNEMALRVAAGDAFRKGLQASGIVLLEPIMRLEIATPEEYMGDFVSDLQQRRAIITKTHTRGKLTLLEAEAPLANLFGYSSAMRSLSQGRATSSMEPLTYGPAPPDVIKSFML